MFKIARLEQALTLVEDTALQFLGIWQMLYDNKKIDKPPYGLAKNHQKFREYLLSIKDSGIKNNFEVSPEFLLPTLADEYFGAATGIHIDIANWMAKSRRIYHLSQTMAVQLALTPVDNITWQDINLPFDSFAISLDQPITTKNKIIDFIIVSKFKMEDQEVLSFDLLSPELQYLPPLNVKDRKLIMRYIKRKDYYKFLKKYNAHISLIKKTLKNLNTNSRVLLLTEIIANQSIHASIATLGNITNPSLKETRHSSRPYAYTHDFNEWNEAANIICGLCLYLSEIHLNSQNSKSKGEKINTVSVDYSAITSIEDICSVADEIVLSPQEKGVIEKTQGRTWEMSAHFRRGHWRKTDDGKKIWIRPTLVRADRLPDNSLPKGAIYKI